MPAAADGPARIAVGIVQESGNDDRTPAVASERAAIAIGTLVAFNVVMINPTPPAMAEKAKCQRRSPRASELRLIRIITTAAQPYGMELKRPTFRGSLTRYCQMLC